MRTYDEDAYDDRPEPLQDEGEVDHPHSEPLDICPGKRVAPDCFCPTVRTFYYRPSSPTGEKRMVPILACLCCSGVPA